jgi:N6-adenosine-specific RNA methylase IME4
VTHFRTIVADPPWPMKWRGGAGRRRNGRGVVYSNAASSQTRLSYPTMSVAEIAALNVPALVTRASVLFLWAPDSFVIDGSATRVCEAWGFKPQRFIVWRKRGFGLGTFPRPQHELVLLGKRGSTTPRRRNVGSVQEWKLVYERKGKSAARRHSAKPPDFLAMVESVYDGPYLELFARSARLGWSVYGNEVPRDAAIADALEVR